MTELEMRGAEQKLRALADAFDRPSPVAAHFQAEGSHPELWDQLDRLARKRRELAERARTLALRGGSMEEFVALLNKARRCEREEDKVFVRAFWEDMGAGG